MALFQVVSQGGVRVVNSQFPGDPNLVIVPESYESRDTDSH